MIQRTSGTYVHLKGHGEWHFVPARGARLAVDGTAKALAAVATTSTTPRPVAGPTPMAP